VTVAFDGVMRQVARGKLDNLSWHDDETKKFIAYWFGQSQILQLTALAGALNEVQPSNVRRVLQLAMSRLIVTKTPKASLASDTSHSRPHRTTLHSSFDVFAGFEQSVNSLVRLLSQRTLPGTADVSRGDARSLAGVGDSSVDLMVTSPPYLNAIDYLRGHRLSLVWLGYSISELRSIRSGSIGAERKLPGHLSSAAEATLELIEADASDRSLLPRGIIRRYAHDMERFALEAGRVVKPGGSVLAVIGNSTLRGNYIRNDEITRRALLSVGFRDVSRVERELPESRRYLPIGRDIAGDGLEKRMRSEVVIRLTRPAP
jgi:hypothetical protein